MSEAPEISIERITNIINDNEREKVELEAKNNEIKNELINNFLDLKNYYSTLANTKGIEDELKPDFDAAIASIKPEITSISITLENLISILNSINNENSKNLSYLESISFTLESLKKNYKNSNEIFYLKKDIFSAKSTLYAIVDYIGKYKSDSDFYNEIITKHIKNMLVEAENELKDFKEIKDTIKNFKTEDYYNQAEIEYKDRAKENRDNFFGAIAFSIGIAIILVVIKPILGLETFDYWFMKGSLIIVAITVISFFLKQAMHYQRLADQAKQTRLELQAFPTYMVGVDAKDVAEIRKVLSKQYFGKEIDSTPHKDIANLISDQMKNTTEMVKAATDALKSKGGS